MKTLNIITISVSLIFVLIGFNGLAQNTKFKIIKDIPANEITLSASSTFGPDQSINHLTDGSGIHNNIHDNNGNALTMWHTTENPVATIPAKGLPACKAWVRFDFSTQKSFNKLLIWNHNQENLTNRGFRLTKVYGTTNGIDWFELATLELSDAKDLNGKASEIVINEKRPLRAVIIAGISNWGGNVYGLSGVKFISELEVNESALPFPTGIECTSTSIYRYCKDGKPGREIMLAFTGNNLYQPSVIEVMADGRTETTAVPYSIYGLEKTTFTLPSGVGIDKEIQIFVTLKSGGKSIRKSFVLPKQRQWTVYIYPHAHVDIGYTNTQANVEIIHKRNLVNGMMLAKETANYPDGARYVWNPEVMWPVERYLKNATPTEREELLDAIRKGYIHLDAGYINDNTSVTADEEFPRFFGDAKRLEKLTGVPVSTIDQTDVPGMSWGIVPMAVQFGIKYIFAPFNGSDRIGLADKFSFKPFWWIGQDGVSKVLFLQPGDYTPGAREKGFKYWPLMAGQKDPNKLLQIVKTDHPRENFIDGYLWGKLKQLEDDSAYSYDIFPMTWAMADNTPIDADLPDAVKSWNEEYAFPHLVIASSTDIMSAFEKKYGDIIPSFRGDFTEYWTDGLGSAAKETSMNRKSKERLIQTDILWSMLHPWEKAPRAEMDEAWRNVLMGSEHTWCYMNPYQADMQDEIWGVKQNFFKTAEKSSIQLLANTLNPVSTDKSNIICVFNTLSWVRSGLVTLSSNQSEGALSVWDDNHKLVNSQRLSTGELVFLAVDVPALGTKNYTLSTESGEKHDVKMAKGNTLDNGLVKVLIDPITGDITSLKDKKGVEFVNTGAACNLNSFRYLLGNGKPASSGPQYAANTTASISILSQKPVNATGPIEVQTVIKENGPLLASIQVNSKADGCNKLIREVRVIADMPEIEIDNLVDKIATTEKEGIHFGFSFNIPDGRTRIDVPWSVVEIDADQLPAANRNWICFQRWLDISNEDKGITWCSLDAPTFESGNMTANIIGGAFHSPEWIQHLPLSSTIYSWALNNHWHTNFPLSQGGKLNFRYRILPHQYGYDAVKANRFGLEQSQPLIATPVKEKIIIHTLVKIDNANVFISIIKTAADGKSMIIRLRSLSEKPEMVNLSFPSFTPKSIRTCIADETPGKEVGNTINMLPHGITSLIIE
ncbi:Glycosyl hydrolases family 38 N-terminal domain-containing protein [Mucilaginibacter mallensis]|uniref:Glycosyl hydrolases family 38 N-terminal domain-containing protein n=1 Tax=Mucilaginibacter mallensis TaxID=652787 RepID=A0A1H1RHP2_MUCMA|nr:glycoside hydrolase family 38 C-terminal domain-containing protein [Mucilaginibacter mallensis]SDS35228.1 Glycosyl hydrolases family 38 N-terminal domain-containing protein [Mucilaginibacter mallensis]